MLAAFILYLKLVKIEFLLEVKLALLISFRRSSSLISKVSDSASGKLARAIFA